MKPPEKIPENLLAEFTLDGKMNVVYNYDDATTEEIQRLINSKFTKEELERSVRRAQYNDQNYYGLTDKWLYAALEKFPIEGKEVCIIGSTYPWYEAIALSRGAEVIDVIEYSDRSIPHEKIRYLKPGNADKKYDVCISISSFEHDGLGRYGDPINPTGDLEAMKHMKDVVKPGGLMLLAVPVGTDCIYFNRHRVYGEHRLPLLLEGWEEVAAFGYSEPNLYSPNNGEYQPVFVLRNS